MKKMLTIIVAILICCALYALVMFSGSGTKDVGTSDVELPNNPEPKSSDVVSPKAQVSEQKQQAKDGSMSPKQAAQVFFQACADRNWDGLLKFFHLLEGGAAPPHFKLIKDFLGGLEVISLGEPVQGQNPDHWFVPYKIKLASGEIRERRLSIVKNKNTGRFYFDGGI